jgi:hypothetical protein
MPSRNFPPFAHGRPVREFRSRLKKMLSLVFPFAPVEVEWAALRDEHGIFSPRIDAAVGPFAMPMSLGGDHDRMIRKYRPLLKKLYEAHRANLSAYASTGDGIDFEALCAFNPGAQCFLAFEIENAASRKHLMGGALNAAALGRIGLYVTMGPERLRTLVRMRGYLGILAKTSRNVPDPSNLLLLSGDQLMAAMNAFLDSQRGKRSRAGVRVRV